MKRTIIFSALTALLVTLTTLSVYIYFQQKDNQTVRIEHVNSSPAHGVMYGTNEAGEVVPLDFTGTVDQVLPAVVHIKSTQTFNRGEDQEPQANPQIPDPFRDFFDPFFRQNPYQNQEPQVRMGTGSGVIIDEKGYIVTNNHVVADADDLEVTLHDNRTFKASVVGTDPSTDLALIRIDASGLSTLPLVNSDNVKVGEWVLAFGNPLGLNSTVTAGIVSAKGRNINILREQFAVESFIQTDAAINPGNSGGALVNLDGGLVGINTAIASPTGTYAGYGFAVPSNIVTKVVEDLLKFGTVQRGVLGVMIRSVDGNLAKDKGLTVNTGAYVDSLLDQSAAAASGIKPGDVIVAVDGQPVNSSPELQERIARQRPGDMVRIKVNRKGDEKVFSVTLKNREGGAELAKKQEYGEALRSLGAEFETLDASTSKKLDIAGGVKVSRLYAGKLRQQTNMREGFIITKVDGKSVRTVDDLAKILENKKGGVMLEGRYENSPEVHYYAFGIGI